jgi:hypothetical protein
VAATTGIAPVTVTSPNRSLTVNVAVAVVSSARKVVVVVVPVIAAAS